VLTAALRAARALFVRVGSVLTVGVLACVTYAVWLYVADEAGFEQTRSAHLASLSREVADRRGKRDETRGRIEALQAELQASTERSARAGRVIESLLSLESFWERWFGNREQQRANDRQIERMRELQRSEKEKSAELRRSLKQEDLLLRRAEEALSQSERQLRAVESMNWEWWYYLQLAWMRARWWLVVGCVALLVAPYALRLLLYFFFAPAVSRSRPIVFASEATALPIVSGASRVLPVALWPGEVLRVRSSLSVEAPAALARRRSWFMSARFPLASVVAGFARSCILHHQHAGDQEQLTLSAEKLGLQIELLEVQLPEGGGLIVRPSHIAGLIYDRQKVPKIRRRWRVWHLQSWASGQFGYFEVYGPCRLILSGRSTLKAERLSGREGGVRVVRRVPADTAVAFTPNLEYRPARTDRMAAYCRGAAALFDSTLWGDGLLVVQDFARSKSRRQQLGRLKMKVFRLVGI
jgi:hypothetical protein